MNATSSRSHTLFMLYILGIHEASGKKLQGCLNLVDLAGSERVNRYHLRTCMLRSFLVVDIYSSTIYPLERFRFFTESLSFIFPRTRVEAGLFHDSNVLV